MKLLWEHGEMTVAELQETLDSQSPLAYSTVATVVSRMEKKGLVTHRNEDRVYHRRRPEQAYACPSEARGWLAALGE